MRRRILAIAIALSLPVLHGQTRGQTVVGIRGSQFTINGHPAYTPAAGFPNADANLAGTLLNVRAVQAVFDDANYPNQGTRQNPYMSSIIGPYWLEYPDGKWDPDRNNREFVAALEDWRRCGLLAFTVNLQGGGIQEGQFGEYVTQQQPHYSPQPHYNSGFDPEGNLIPAYAQRLRKVIAEADRLGMVVIVGFFYSGSNARIKLTPDGRYVRQAIVNGCRFLKELPYRNVLIEINNETNPRGFVHPILQPDGVLEAVLLAQETVEKQIPVSMSWSGGITPRGSKGDQAIRAVDYVMFHTNSRTPEEVHEKIRAMRNWAGNDRPALVNEDGVSTFNLHAAVQERVGWGYYDQGWNNYRDGFQSPPVNWGINTPIKWLFFEQVARLTGSPIPPRPNYVSDETPVIEVFGLKPNDVVKEPVWVEAIVADRHPRWPIKRVEFFIDGKPYSYRRNAPFMLQQDREWWDPADVPAGKHVLRVAAFDMRGPRFTESCSMVEIPFAVEK